MFCKRKREKRKSSPRAYSLTPKSNGINEGAVSWHLCLCRNFLVTLHNLNHAGTNLTFALSLFVTKLAYQYLEKLPNEQKDERSVARDDEGRTERLKNKKDYIVYAIRAKNKYLKYMNDQELKSTIALSNFIEAFDLSDNYGNIRFSATVHFNLNGTNYYKESEVAIFRDNHPNTGTIRFLNNELDARQYPIDVHANYQAYSFIENSGLMVEGNHRGNSNIGKFSIMIVPKNRY